MTVIACKFCKKSVLLQQDMVNHWQTEEHKRNVEKIQTENGMKGWMRTFMTKRKSKPVGPDTTDDAVIPRATDETQQQNAKEDPRSTTVKPSNAQKKAPKKLDNDFSSSDDPLWDYDSSSSIDSSSSDEPQRKPRGAARAKVPAQAMTPREVTRLTQLAFPSLAEVEAQSRTSTQSAFPSFARVAAQSRSSSQLAFPSAIPILSRTRTRNNLAFPSAAPELSRSRASTQLAFPSVAEVEAHLMTSSQLAFPSAAPALSRTRTRNNLAFPSAAPELPRTRTWNHLAFPSAATISSSKRGFSSSDDFGLGDDFDLGDDHISDYVFSSSDED